MASTSFWKGNTRTTAVFVEKYLNNMEFNVNNAMFKETVYISEIP